MLHHRNKILQGSALEVLKTFPDESVDCVVTSPPYWALRDYGEPGQLGLEKTAGEFVEQLCKIFDEVQRVLKPTGTCFVNIGDTYYGGGRNKGNKNPKVKSKTVRGLVDLGDTVPGPKGVSKCLAQIPARFAIAMTDRGWILRNEIIWHKPNQMPASVKDRFTCDFEKVYFFTKTRRYFFEQQFEPLAVSTLPRYGRGVSEKAKHGAAKQNHKTGAGALSTQRPNIKHTDKKMGTGGTGFQGHSGYFKADGTPLYNPNGRNKRCVWSISTKAFNGAHFAVFPEELCEAPIKAGCPQGGVVLDPFVGSGTTAAVAKRLGRDYVGIELNPEYIKLAESRLKSHGKTK